MRRPTTSGGRASGLARHFLCSSRVVDYAERVRIVLQNPAGDEILAGPARSGLTSEAPSPVPAWARAEIGAETWEGRTVAVSSLLKALEQLPQHLEGTLDATLWDFGDDAIEVDLAIPLMILARELHQMGREGVLGLGVRG